MRSAVVTLLALSLLAVGCGGPETPAAAAPAFPVVETASGGPVKLTVRLSAAEIGLAETLVLEEEVAAEPGFTAELPEFLPEEFDGLGIIDIDEDPLESRATGTVRRRRLTLEPERSGELSIPPREAWFQQEGAETGSVVTTKAVAIKVRPIEDPDALALPPLRPALREDEIAASSGPSAWWAALLLVPAAVVALLLLRRRTARTPPPRPAAEIALESLRRLVALDLIGKGEIERFFVTLSAILREYVERRFGVRAPERTTKEFLAEAAVHPDLAMHRGELEAFLEVSDRVKFALFSPEEKDIQAAFDRARDFVTRTGEEAGHA